MGTKSNSREREQDSRDSEELGIVVNSQIQGADVDIRKSIQRDNNTLDIIKRRC